ncbi:MAG: 4-phosphoerythronate dehydrogenase [Pseudomonadota bacterium]|nr:4-phosphoerythronate dehydrogenase [Pseudomonadota bacterium]
MHILADANFAHAETLFSEFGELTLFTGRQPSEQLLATADALLIRSTTQVDQALISQAPKLGFVGSATIGVDHVDQALLNDREICFSSAPGCNANAVKEYVLSVLSLWQHEANELLTGRSIAIIGCGHVGSKVAQACEALGLEVRVVDPFKSQLPWPQVEFEQALSSDILSFHTPLTRSGEHPTHHLFDAKAMAEFSGQLVINSGRGAVIDHQALLASLGQVSWKIALDVWENEPNISPTVLDKCWLATPHIAGYSMEGKVNGSWQAFQAFCKWRGIKSHQSPASLLPPLKLSMASGRELLAACYQPRHDDANLRDYDQASDRAMSDHFDTLRRTYPFRREVKTWLTQQAEQGHTSLQAVQKAAEQDLWLKALLR